MLKKAGIVVATAAAGLLAVSPLAFAGDKDDHDGRDHDGKKKVKVEDVNRVDDSNRADGRGLVFIADNNVAINNCTKIVRNEDFVSIVDDVVGVLHLFGNASADDSDVQFCDQDASVDDSIEQEIEHEDN